MAKKDDFALIDAGGREVRVSSPGKLYFSQQTHLTKLELVQYYLAVAPGALAGIRDRPFVMKRFVDGAHKEPFYQKRAPENRPEWLRTVTLSFPSGRTAEEGGGGRRGVAGLGGELRVYRAASASGADERSRPPG